MSIVSPYISIITLNINGLHFPMKIHKVGIDDKQDPTAHLQETHFSFKDLQR